ncbi:uncharacterized protein M6B38_182070 [Iris pallida]|uniref:Uncharacterized protein n=1 Tax=Iris pallida TaxID=29817 RepID=A0AAX6ELY9_IRIPA|nr:uncharacterized protein M6B38_182070 [Iris pallida]
MTSADRRLGETSVGARRLLERGGVLLRSGEVAPASFPGRGGTERLGGLRCDGRGLAGCTERRGGIRPARGRRSATTPHECGRTTESRAVDSSRQAAWVR